MLKSGGHAKCDFMFDINTGSRRHVDIFLNQKVHPEEYTKFRHGNIGIGLYRYSGKKVPPPSKMMFEDEKDYYFIERIWLTLEEVKALQKKLDEIISFAEEL